MFAKLRKGLARFCDWSPETLQITPPTRPNGGRQRERPASKAKPTKPTKASPTEQETDVLIQPPQKVKRPVLFRIAQVPTAKDPSKSKWIQVKATGVLNDKDRAFWGVSVDRVDAWYEARAVSLKEARAMVERGDARKVVREEER